MAKIDRVQEVSLDMLKPYQNNAKLHSEDQVERIANSIKEFGFISPCLIDKDYNIIAGHGRVLRAQKIGLGSVPCVFIEGLTEAQRKAYIIADNRLTELGEWDFETLNEELDYLLENDFDINITGFEKNEVLAQNRKEKVERAKGTLRERFLLSPFTVLDSRTGWWVTRKRAWRELGIKSELGRGNDGDVTKTGLTYANSHQSPRIYEKKNQYEELIGEKITWDEFYELFPDTNAQVSTSIFDPVICELVYRWYAKKGDSVIDPFAGGSVRGITAALLGRQYTGIDLSRRQIEANKINWAEMEHSEILGTGSVAQDPEWICGDSLNINELVNKNDFDLLFTCPPYADLEKYSDDPRDISNMKYDDFLSVYNEIIKKAVSKLKQNAFRVIVVGDVRDDNGFYRNFIGDTISAFEAAGMRLYNELILVTSVGAVATVVSRQFLNSRKNGKVHQNCLVFISDGDIKTISLETPEDQEQDTTRFIKDTNGKMVVNHKKILTFMSQEGDGHERAMELGPVENDTNETFYVNIE